MYFNINIKYLRTQKELSQQILANELGLKKSNVGAWEEGRAFPKQETLIKLANYFSCSIDDLLTKDISQNAQVNAQVNTQVNANLNTENNIQLEEKAGECTSCKEKERVIKSQKEQIIGLQQQVQDLREDKEDCRGMLRDTKGKLIQAERELREQGGSRKRNSA
jgi:transcriptional regulator with XRE-family HTH domain